MYLGVDYYPEQWEKSMMSNDMDNIIELGSNVIRIAEFAWHLMEKKEGEYDFSFFDNVIRMAKEKGLKVILGTPTAAIPAWLAKKHPTIISEFEGGRKRVFGGRHVYCFNSPHMYEYSEKIIRKMAEHFKDEDSVVAWQIDNEFGHEGSDICYCDNCRKAFQKYLKGKFVGDIDLLNETYGTTFWSQEYNDFDEIPIPSETITTHNPALRLDWERFRSNSIVKFADFQVSLIKEIVPDAVVIHDFPGGGLDKHVDYSKVAKHLDISAYNNYPVWGGQREPVPPNEIAFGLDYIRGLKGDNFWITEAIMGAQGHDVTGFLPRPNQAKMWSYQGMARGCNSMLYFRYRGATKGAEQFCYGVIDADNRKRRKFFEVQSFFNEIKNYANIFDTKFKSEVAVVYDYDSLAAFRIQRQSILLDTSNEMKKIHKVFYDQNVNVDVIPEDRDFSEYKVIVLPQMIIKKNEMKNKIEEYVNNGGTVVFTYRTAVKNVDNNLELNKMIPLDYDKLAGVYVDETESLQDFNAFAIKGCGEFEKLNGYGGIFRDMLVSVDAEVLYKYDDEEYYKNYAAVTRKKNGNGMVYYIGCGVDEDTLKNIMFRICNDNDITRIDSPDGVEVVRRGDNLEKTFVINHNNYEVVYNGKTYAPFECCVL